MTVHKDALLIKRGKRVVFLAQNGKALIRHVSLGVATGSRFSITNGLKPGDVVVTRGNERLRPGTLITFGKPPGEARADQGASQNKENLEYNSGENQ